MMEKGACLHELNEVDSDTISELIYTQDGVSLMKLRMELKQMNSARHAKNATLSCEVESLRQTIKRSSSLIDQAYADLDAIICSQANWIGKMKQENLALKAKIEQINWGKSMIIEDLEFCLEEHLITIEELRSNNKALEDQLEKGGHVQTKSWWRRQADKVAKGMGTFRQHFKCCLGMKRAFKRNKVHPINSDSL